MYSEFFQPQSFDNNNTGIFIKTEKTRMGIGSQAGKKACHVGKKPLWPLMVSAAHSPSGERNKKMGVAEECGEGERQVKVGSKSNNS